MNKRSEKASTPSVADGIRRVPEDRKLRGPIRTASEARSTGDVMSTAAALHEMSKGVNLSVEIYSNIVLAMLDESIIEPVEKVIENAVHKARSGEPNRVLSVIQGMIIDFGSRLNDGYDVSIVDELLALSVAYKVVLNAWIQTHESEHFEWKVAE